MIVNIFEGSGNFAPKIGALHNRFSLPPVFDFGPRQIFAIY
jgi:hypothetical protein